MEESSSLLAKPSSSDDGQHWVTVRVPSVGLRHFTGIASRYSNEYPAKLTHVLTSSEFIDIIVRLNETIADYWPCTTCYYFGYLCCPCTFGLSVFIPNYCASYSELYATAFLRNISLKAHYFDRKITFTLIKSFCSSYIEIKFPAQLLNDHTQCNSNDIERQITYHYETIHIASNSPTIGTNNSSLSNNNSSSSNNNNSSSTPIAIEQQPVDLSNIIITSVPSAAAFITKERLKKL